jgi:hypothetical protein
MRKIVRDWLVHSVAVPLLEIETWAMVTVSASSEYPPHPRPLSPQGEERGELWLKAHSSLATIGGEGGPEGRVRGPRPTL